MRRLSRFNKIVYLFNIVAIILLLATCFVPIIHNERFSFLSFLGLVVPALVMGNILFVLYWAVQRKRQLFGSVVVLLISYLLNDTFFKWNFREHDEIGDLTVMSYNVRAFNMYGELPSLTIMEDIKAFIKTENPDILCIQEPYYNSRKEFENYPYHFLEYYHMEGKGLLAIFSKYPILETGVLDLPRTKSNAVFADVLYKKDTIRIYNVHLESLGITPGQGVLRKEPTEKLFKQVNTAFQKQVEQAKVVDTHMASTPFKTILCGDFNNGPYSNVYRILKGNLQDTFLETGSGFGHTYIFHGIPFRIDFIFSDKSFKVKSHTNYEVKYSDHFPVMASFELGSD